MALDSSRRGSVPAHQAGALGAGRRRPRAQPGRAMTRPLTRALLVGFIAAAVLAALAASANAHPTARSDAVTAWNENAGKAAIAACISPNEDPLHESRLYAMTHVAIHDALNAIDRRSRPYAWDGRAKRRASPDAAVAAAARDVLVALLNEITDPFRRHAAKRASRASKRTTRPRSAPFRMVEPRRAASRSDRRLHRPFSA